MKKKNSIELTSYPTIEYWIDDLQTKEIRFCTKFHHRYWIRCSDWISNHFEDISHKFWISSQIFHRVHRIDSNFCSTKSVMSFVDWKNEEKQEINNAMERIDRTGLPRPTFSIVVEPIQSCFLLQNWSWWECSNELRRQHCARKKRHRHWTGAKRNPKMFLPCVVQSNDSETFYQWHLHHSVDRSTRGCQT